MAQRSHRTNRNSRSRQAASGGIGVLFAIMAAVVVAVIATAFVVGAGDDEPAPGPDQPAASPEYVVKETTKRTDWPEVEPWQGLRLGMARGAVIAKFGEPNARTVMKYKSLETLEFHNSPDRVGMFGDAGGVRLTVYIDTDTNKVVYFTPPKTAEQTYREHQQQRNQ